MERSKESIGNQLPAECHVLRWVFKFNAREREVEWGFCLFVCLNKLSENTVARSSGGWGFDTGFYVKI